MSCGDALSAIAARIVVTRSAADTPVVTPARASIDTVNAVPFLLSFNCAIGGSSSARTFSSVRHRQTMPLHSRINSAIVSSVSRSAATIRSASFSRSWSSCSTTARPSRSAASAAAMRGGTGSASSNGKSENASAGADFEGNGNDMM